MIMFGGEAITVLLFIYTTQKLSMLMGLVKRMVRQRVCALYTSLGLLGPIPEPKVIREA
jgi:hypothetical protein